MVMWHQRDRGSRILLDECYAIPLPPICDLDSEIISP
jgi:hypothetical protein